MLSGSDKKYGEIRISIIKMKIVILNPKISFHEKKDEKRFYQYYNLFQEGY